MTRKLFHLAIPFRMPAAVFGLWPVCFVARRVFRWKRCGAGRRYDVAPDNKRGWWRPPAMPKGGRSHIDNPAGQDYVSEGGGIIGIYSVTGREKTVRPRDGSALKIHMDPFTTTCFDIQHLGVLLQAN